MPRDYRVYLDDIVEAAARISDYIRGLDIEGLKNDRKTLDAIVRNLEVIGEATKGIPDEVRSRYPDIEWKKIAGLRDILIHQYFGIDVNIVWDVIKNKLPLFERQVKSILSE